jgi:hypothetical protein
MASLYDRRPSVASGGALTIVLVFPRTGEENT